MTGRRVAFYAPLKAPQHPVASGDRTMGRALLAALRAAGHEPEMVSELRLLEGRGDLAAFQRLGRAAAGEAERYVAACRSRPAAERPAAFFTYHCYFKAPDLIGPAVAAALDIPYLVAEPSSAPKRASGFWSAAHHAAEAAFDAADLLLVMTARDREAFAARGFDPGRIRSLPPFLARMPDPPGERPPSGGTVELLTVAMMRQSNKRLSYLQLADALTRLDDAPWRLTVAGDGPARREIEAAFARFGDRVRFLGLIHGLEALDDLYRSADLFVWPAVTEAYGVSLLEAQACGAPCVAGRDGGVPDVVVDGRTGLLTPPGDPAAFAAAIRALIRDPARRRTLGGDAARFVREERSLAAASRRLAEAMATAAACHARRAGGTAA